MRGTWLLGIVLFACGDEESLPLDERRFVLQSGYAAVTGTTPTLTFDEGELGYSGGCNDQGGSFSVRTGKLVVTELSSDAAACAAPLHAQDEFFATFLTSRPAIDLDGATLSLRGAVTLVFIEAP